MDLFAGDLLDSIFAHSPTVLFQRRNPFNFNFQEFVSTNCEHTCHRARSHHPFHKSFLPVGPKHPTSRVTAMSSGTNDIASITQARIPMDPEGSYSRGVSTAPIATQDSRVPMDPPVRKKRTHRGKRRRRRGTASMTSQMGTTCGHQVSKSQE